MTDPTGPDPTGPDHGDAGGLGDADEHLAGSIDERATGLPIDEIEVIEVVESDPAVGESPGARIFDLRPARAPEAAPPPAASAAPVDAVTRPRRGGPLAGRVAVVTGASGPVGRAVALALSAAGARVCALGRDLAALRETAGASSGPVVHLQCDIGSVSEIEGVVDFIERLDRPVDLLVHAEAVIVRGGVEHGSVNDLDEQYLVNVRGPYLLSQRLLPALRAGDGHVVFVTSTPAPGSRRLGQHAIVGRAVDGLAEELRREAVPSGMRVTSVTAEVTDDEDEGTASPDDLASQLADAVLAAVTLDGSTELADVRLRLTSTARREPARDELGTVTPVTPTAVPPAATSTVSEARR